MASSSSPAVSYAERARNGKKIRTEGANVWNERMAASCGPSADYAIDEESWPEVGKGKSKAERRTHSALVASSNRGGPQFGSIATPRSPSPHPITISSIQDNPKPFPQFTIGVAPGEIRSRTTTADGLAEDHDKIIDLTGGKSARWSFGTVAAVDAVLSPISISPPKNAEAIIEPPLAQSSPGELHKRLEQLVLRGGEDDSHNPFEVKDYGYGFGSRESSRSSPQPPPQKPSGGPWERDRAEYPHRHSKREGPSRRGYHSQSHNPNYAHGSTHEGRAYTPRRGRGYGRGAHTHRRNGSGSISGYPHQYPHPHPHQPMHVRPPPPPPPPPPPFSVTPPFDPVGFYPGRPMIGMGGMNGMNGIGMNGMYYDGPAYAAPPIPMPMPPPAPAPVPAPVTPLAFPLDTTRWYLLGQLEYYLSAQNMAQDYFLRQKLDSKGWVPISLIASFKRVRHLTEDEALVREVLTLSSVVEVHGDWVRMKDWEAFVLPDALPSTVTVEQDAADMDEAEDDEDEDDVVFVLSRD